MDSFEIASEASLDSFHLNSEDFNAPSPFPPPPAPEFMRRIQDLELENEKLRYSLENSKTETISLKASNKGLREKIGDLFQEAQTSLQEKLKLANSLKEKECQVAANENSSKWYQARLHESEAVNRGLRGDLEAYQKILHQREQKIDELMADREENNRLRSKIEEIEGKYFRERDTWLREMNLAQHKMAPPVEDKMADVMIFELKKRVDEVVHQLEIADKRYLNMEMLKNLAEESVIKCERRIERMEKELDGVTVMKNEEMEKVRVLMIQGEDLRIENERLSVVLLASKKEKGEVEEAIVQLRLQLMKMIAEHRAVKCRIAETEKKLKEVEEENGRLKTRILSLNTSMSRKIREEKNNRKALEELLKEEKARSAVNYQKGETVSSMTICLQQALNRERDLKDRLKLLSKSPDESVDEGYGDISAGFTDIPLSSPSPINSALTNYAVNVLMRSQNFMAPVKSSLNELESKIKRVSSSTEFIKCR